MRLVGSKLEFRLKKEVANVEGLVDRLAKYIRARLPQITQIHETHRDGVNIH